MMNRNVTDGEDIGAEAKVEIATGNVKDDATMAADIENHTEENTKISDHEDIRLPSRGPLVGAHTLLQIPGTRLLITGREAHTDHPIVKTGSAVDTTMTEDAMTSREKRGIGVLDLNIGLTQMQPE